MGAVNDALAGRDLVDAIDKNCAFGAQLVHHVAVMDDLLADVNRRPEGLERDADDVDGAHHAGAEATRLQQKHSLGVRLTFIHSCVVQYTGKNPRFPTLTLL